MVLGLWEMMYQTRADGARIQDEKRTLIGGQDLHLWYSKSILRVDVGDAVFPARGTQYCQLGHCLPLN